LNAKIENCGKSSSKNIRTLNVFGRVAKTTNYSFPKIINTIFGYGKVVYVQYSINMRDVCYVILIKR
jgi:hypothetical protein